MGRRVPASMMGASASGAPSGIPPLPGTYLESCVPVRSMVGRHGTAVQPDFRAYPDRSRSLRAECQPFVGNCDAMIVDERASRSSKTSSRESGNCL